MRLSVPIGKRFGILTVMAEGELLRLPSGQTNRTILCRCDCGNEKQIRLVHLNHGRIKSCGCLIGEFHDRTPIKLYQVWHGMRQRCSKDYNDHSHRYKDRGISVCPEWDGSFIKFRAWALQSGYKEGLQIDRIDNNGNYSPENCRFVDRFVNANNKENTFLVKYKGITHAMMPLLRTLNKVDLYGIIRTRIKRGWDADKAIDKPVRVGNYKGFVCRGTSKTS